MFAVQAARNVGLRGTAGLPSSEVSTAGQASSGTRQSVLRGLQRYAAIAIAFTLLCTCPVKAGDPDPTKTEFSSQPHASLLGIEAQGSKFVYVFDHSGSMGVPGNRPLDRAKKELLASLDGLSDL